MRAKKTAKYNNLDIKFVSLNNAIIYNHILFLAAVMISLLNFFLYGVIFQTISLAIIVIVTGRVLASIVTTTVKSVEFNEKWVKIMYWGGKIEKINSLDIYDIAIKKNRKNSKFSIVLFTTDDINIRVLEDLIKIEGKNGK